MSRPAGPAEHDQAEGRSSITSEERTHIARIKGVSSAQAGLYIKIAYHFTRRSIAKLAGRQTQRMIEPLEMYAHVPVLFNGYAELEQATAKLHRLDKRLQALAELKAATLTHCDHCIDMGSAISRRWGLTDEELLALPGYQTSPLFSKLDNLGEQIICALKRSSPANLPHARKQRSVAGTGSRTRYIT